MVTIPRLLAAAAFVALGACEPTTRSLSVGSEGVGVGVESGDVRAAVGPNDAAVAVQGDRVVAGVGTDDAAAGVRVDGGPAVAGIRRSEDDGGVFGGIGFGF